MAITLRAAGAVLERHGLLREIVAGHTWTLDAQALPDRTFTTISYDTRTAGGDTLLVCKGRFRPDYLDQADRAGVRCYVAEREYSSHTAAVGLIVDDVRKAMALLGAAFYDYPQRELTLVGITGTKGKTTTAYFTQAMLNAYTGGRTALLSSVDNCIDGHTYTESELTTPESLDLFRLMRQAVDQGMRYLVMEVSSQAYKVNRVFGLSFDVGAFLNISPDHISPIEHPTFEDYLFCKRQIARHSRVLILGADCAHADLIRQDAAAAGAPVLGFALRSRGQAAHCPDHPFIVARPETDSGGSTYALERDGRTLGEFSLSMEGLFNVANAAAAAAIITALGIPVDSRLTSALASVRVSGRMERFTSPEGVIAYVDYAHNSASVNALLDFIDQRYGALNPRITLVTGSTGDKAIDRRREIVDAAQHRVSRMVFTAEDTDREPFERICEQMRGYVTDPSTQTAVVPDRAQAIANAYDDALAHHPESSILLIIGKGEERWIKNGGRHVPYESDTGVVRRLFGRRS